MDGNVGITVAEVLSTHLDDGMGGVRLVCRFCGHAITSERARIEVDGAHEHRKINPAGAAFHIGCFRRAPGVKGWGGAFMEHSWFDGYTWQIALCASCNAHLGWTFEAAGDRFHGLILDRLRAEDERRPGA